MLEYIQYINFMSKFKKISKYYIHILIISILYRIQLTSSWNTNSCLIIIMFINGLDYNKLLL